MSVGNIEIFHVGKALYQHADFCIAVNDPYRMPNAVFGNKVIYRRYRRCIAIDDGFGVSIFLVSQENGACVGVEGIHMADTVCFFVGTGQLVLFDGVIQIFVNGGADNQSCLVSAVHGQSIDIQIGQQILCENAFVQLLIESIPCFFINSGAVRVCTHGQIDFRPVNM